ncbi:MAG: hypothetical protein M1820_003622 [Bogoriella megaspora]|nr:MAG: hypothetical protein M1820_003622 [Bogoriella megaspora]
MIFIPELELLPIRAVMHRTSDADKPFVFPVKRLENDTVCLVPFDVASQASIFVEGTKHHPKLFEYTTYGPFQSVEEFEDDFYWPRVGEKEETVLWSIFKKQLADQDEKGSLLAFAGVLSLNNSSRVNGVAEIGHVIILPAFHRTHVTSNAVGLLLCYTLDPPPGGLGLRRSVWQAHADNQASRRVASRMGYTLEGIQRFQRVMPEGKQGNAIDVVGFPSVIEDLGPSRDTAIFAHYCDEWPGKRDTILQVMNGKS